MFFISGVFVFIGYHIHFKLRTKKEYKTAAGNLNLQTVDTKEVKASDFYWLEEALLSERYADTGICPIHGLSLSFLEKSHFGKAGYLM
jgi:hypothetical protein